MEDLAQDLKDWQTIDDCIGFVLLSFVLLSGTGTFLFPTSIIAFCFFIGTAFLTFFTCLVVAPSIKYIMESIRREIDLEKERENIP